MSHNCEIVNVNCPQPGTPIITVMGLSPFTCNAHLRKEIILGTKLGEISRRTCVSLRTDDCQIVDIKQLQQNSTCSYAWEGDKFRLVLFIFIVHIIGLQHFVLHTVIHTLMHTYYMYITFSDTIYYVYLLYILDSRDPFICKRYFSLAWYSLYYIKQPIPYQHLKPL